jgi:acetolactate synthase-1/2/3 large subunit
MMRVADYIMTRLADAGIGHVFQVTGRGALFLNDALAKETRLTAISLHHEQSCSYAAVAYAEQTGNLGACLVSTGCASTNTITGCLSAWQDAIPTIFISGQNILKETTRFTGIPLRSFGQQEADIISIVSPITKYATMISKPEEIIDALEIALFEALNGRKGPVWIDVPLDLQSSLIDPNTIERAKIGHKIIHPVSEVEVEQILVELKKAERPVVLIGSGVKAAKSEHLLREFIETNQIPLVFTASAVDTIGSSHALSIGSVGAMGCSRAGNFTLQNADLLIVFGSRLNSLTTGLDFCKFAREAKIIVVDIDPIEHSKPSIKIDFFIKGDVGDLLERLLHQKLNLKNDYWVSKTQHWKQVFQSIDSTLKSDDKGIDLYDLAKGLGNTLPNNSTLVTDSGLNEVILPTNINFRDGMHCIHPVSQGAMGFALPAAIGSQFGSNGLVVTVIGDGSIMMNLQELESIKYLKLPIKIIVVSNNVYSIIRRRQRDLFRKRLIGVDPSNGVSCPNFEKVASCFEIGYQRIETINDLNTGLELLFKTEGPVLCELIGKEFQEYIEVGQVKSSVDGRLTRRPLEDQIPFMDRNLFLDEMIVKPIDQ